VSPNEGWGYATEVLKKNGVLRFAVKESERMAPILSHGQKDNLGHFCGVLAEDLTLIPPDQGKQGQVAQVLIAQGVERKRHDEFRHLRPPSHRG
jgi:hypothetical protein